MLPSACCPNLEMIELDAPSIKTFIGRSDQGEKDNIKHMRSLHRFSDKSFLLRVGFFCWVPLHFLMQCGFPWRRKGVLGKSPNRRSEELNKLYLDSDLTGITLVK